jgi:hypothetical protein
MCVEWVELPITTVVGVCCGLGCGWWLLGCYVVVMIKCCGARQKIEVWTPDRLGIPGYVKTQQGIGMQAGWDQSWIHF